MPTPEADSDLQDLRRQINDIGLGVLVFLVVPLGLLAAQQGFGLWQSAVLVALALFTGGVFIGFLFGVPKVATSALPATETETPKEAARRRILDVNTNLEQISDWLTKIIVGLGLVELKQIPGAIAHFTSFIAAAFHETATTSASAIGATLYFPVLGFLGGYLLTRLYLASLISRADEQLGGAAKQDRITALVGAAAGAGKSSDSEVGSTASTVRAAVAETPISRFGDATILWVDDNPSNNTYLIRAFHELGVQVDLARSTEEALERLRSNPRYSAIITDMGRKDDPRAGYTLLKALREMGIQIPTIVYASSDSPEHRKEAIEAGAVDSTNRADRVFQLVTEAIRQRPRAGGLRSSLRLPWPFGGA